MRKKLKTILALLLIFAIIFICSCGIKSEKVWDEASSAAETSSSESENTDDFLSSQESAESEISETLSVEESEEESDESSAEEASSEVSEEAKPVITYFGINIDGQALEWNINENIISLELPYTFDMSLLKNVTPEISSDGIVTGLDDGRADLTENIDLTVTGDNGVSSVYTVKTDYIYLGLPVVFIEVENGSEVLSKETDLICTVRIDSAHCADFFPSFEASQAAIHGRGHYSWQFDKKSFTFKLDEKRDVLGLGKAKKWVLTANYTDKSLLQNYLALEMAKATALDNLHYTVTQYPVDLFINGTYRGVYTLGEKIEVNNNRIELDTEAVEDMAFLIELGGAEEGDKVGKDYYNIGLLIALTIKCPENDEITEEQKEYILNYLAEADAAVRNLDKYEDYIDVDSLIDWAILYELTSNTDGVFRRSGYMYKDAGGKLCMGPVWDFDLAFGNFLKYEKDTWACKGSDEGYVPYNWMNILLEDEAFRTKLKSRWDEVKSELYSYTLEKLEYIASVAAPSATLNFKVWDILNTRVLSNPRNWYEWKTWEAHIQRLRDYLEERYNWMDANF
ncbi:MAG: CotH kinase family protein [Eubacteriales bacterium]|nr:CotH kinase family protein [Eubacteriales bacterium]